MSKGIQHYKNLLSFSHKIAERIKEERKSLHPKVKKPRK